ncbi:MAG: DUF3438 family protein, partial [Rhodobacteraceae bacterium]|nr:DUF3438 family protein [Paracoccaceae bacterium]
MKWKLVPLIALFIALPVLAGNAADPPPVERIVWHKAPIAITLPVGVERLVTFPGEARVGVPGTLQPLLRTQSVAGTVYWLAHEAFDAHRIQVQNLDSGEIYLIDLKAVEDKDSAAPPVEIVSKNGAGRTSEPLPADGENEPPVPLDYVALTRFAAQQLYAPSRLLRTPPGV